jgi:hypothetical protein
MRRPRPHRLTGSVRRLVAAASIAYLWPLFLLLDVIAAPAGVVVLRKTWSATPGAD